MGWQETLATIFEGTDFVFNSGGMFFYNGPPAFGNLIISITNNEGTDPFGNLYDFGVSIFSLDPNNPPNGKLQLNFFDDEISWSFAATAAGPYHGGASISWDTGGLGMLIDADAVNIDVSTGAIVLGALSTFINLEGPIQLGVNLPPAVSTKPYLFTNANGTPTFQTGNGFKGQASISDTDTTTGTNNNQAVATAISKVWSIPANDMQVGTIYEIEVPWSCTMEAQTLTFGLSVNQSATFSAQQGISGAIGAAGTNLVGTIRVFMEITATGTSGTFNAWVDGTLAVRAALTLFTNSGAMADAVQTGLAINTTVANSIQINTLWAASVAGQTVSGFGSKISRYGS